MAENKVVNLEVKEKGMEEMGQKTLSLKAKLKELKDQMALAGDGTAEFKKLAAEAGALQDRIADVNRQVKNLSSDTRRLDLGLEAVQGVTGGFAAAQGAMSLFGDESEEMQKTMMKVMGAMSLVNGVQQVANVLNKDAVLGTKLRVFWNETLVGSFKKATIAQKAFMATGIGLLLTGIATLVAYWDDIAATVSGVSDEQERLNAKVEANVNLEKAKLDSIGAQDNILKLQGKSEREILELKLKQTDAVLLATQAQLEQQENTKKAEVAAAKRNYDITKMIVRGAIEIAAVGLRLLAAPIDLVLETANAVSEALGFGKITTTNINKEISKLTESAASGISKFIFDPQQIAADSNEAIRETKASITKLKNEKAGLILSIRAIDKQDRQQSTKEKKKDVKKEEEEIELIKRESGLKALNNLKKQRNAELEVTKKSLEDEAKLREEAAQKELERQKKLQEDKSKLVYDSLNLISEITSLFGQKNERVARAMFNIDKAARLASATMSAREGVINAFKTAQDSPLTAVLPAYPFIQAGLAGAFGAVNIAKIASQKFQASGGASDLASGGGGGGGGSAGGQAPSFNVVGNSGVNQLAQLQQQPVQAYVVSGSVTTAQSLDRNRIENATL